MAGEYALHTGGTSLKWGESKGTYNNEIKVKSISDLGSEPAPVDVTELTETKRKQSIDGLQDFSTITCTGNYTKEKFKAAMDACDGTVKYFQISISGDKGGAFEFAAKAQCWLNAISVDAAQEFTISLTIQGDIDHKESA